MGLDGEMVSIDNEEEMNFIRGDNNWFFFIWEIIEMNYYYKQFHLLVGYLCFSSSFSHRNWERE